MVSRALQTARRRGIIMEVKLTKDNFASEVEIYNGTVLVDFWAPWCGPCRMLAPVVEEFAENHADTVKVGKVNVDEEVELAGRFNIMSIPTVIVFKNGKPAATSIGLVDGEELETLVG